MTLKGLDFVFFMGARLGIYPLGSILLEQIKGIAKEGLIDLGIGVIDLGCNFIGKWVRSELYQILFSGKVISQGRQKARGKRQKGGFTDWSLNLLYQADLVLPEERCLGSKSGLDKENCLKAIDPAAVFIKQNKQRYEDALGDRIIGSWQNCLGGRFPWANVLSPEEDFRAQVLDSVRAVGFSFFTREKPFFLMIIISK